MKCICFESLLSPCAWLVKWHNCKCVNDSVSDITKKFSLFCNFSASRSITTQLLILGYYYYWYWNCDIIELLKYCKELNKSVMKQSACSASYLSARWPRTETRYTSLCFFTFLKLFHFARQIKQMLHLMAQTRNAIFLLFCYSRKIQEELAKSNVWHVTAGEVKWEVSTLLG